MFRILGFLVGSILSMGVLIYLIGMPRFASESNDELVSRFDAAIEKLKEKRPETGVVAAVESPPLPEPAEPVEPLTADIDAAPHDHVRAPAAAPEAPAVDQGLEAPAIGQDDAFVAAAEPEWHEFWTPFSSEIAARGFVNRLESVTGLDYRVNRVQSGRYQVEFAYGNPAELDHHLAQIAAATGLDVSGEFR